MALLEDDHVCEPELLTAAQNALRFAPFVSSNQLEIGEDGDILGPPPPRGLGRPWRWLVESRGGVEWRARSAEAVRARGPQMSERRGAGGAP
ncbi:MAG: hypothetical protein AAGC57_21135, partial [Pseudomonadota bacterium]